MGLVVTPEMLEWRFHHLVKPELTDGSHLPHPAQREEEEGRERAREAQQRPTLRVRQTADDLSVPFVLYFCMCVHSIFVYSHPYIEIFGLNLPRLLQAFLGSFLLTSWGQTRGRRTGRRRRSRHGGRTPPGLSRTAEWNRGESRSDRDKSLKTETHSPGLSSTMKLI